MTHFMYCWRTGVVEFGDELPHGALELARYVPTSAAPRGRSTQLAIWRAKMQAACRLAYDNKTWLVPGIPEAQSDVEALAAYKKFIDWLDDRKLGHEPPTRVAPVAKRNKIKGR